MKKYIYIIILVITSFYSCEEVVDVDLETAQERLVIEALIKWERGTDGANQVIKLTKTSSFYNNQIVYASGAIVTVTNTENQQSFIFNETENGLYTTSTFEPVLNAVYDLEIKYNDETYTATSTLFEAPEIIEVTQSIEGGFFTDTPEVNISFQDFIDQEDYYRISFVQYRQIANNVEEIDGDSYIYDASFEENNILSDYYENEDLQAGDSIDISLYKISKQFYNFIYVLEEQAGSGHGPFSSPPVNVKGNIINTTKEDHYPYGYFGLGQVSTASYTFE